MARARRADHPHKVGPIRRALAAAADEVRLAQTEMGDAGRVLTKARDATTSSESLEPAVKSQAKAIEHLEAALRLLQPPQQQDPQQDQQQQDPQQQDPQQQDQQQQDPQQQAGGASQRARDEDARRQRERRKREASVRPRREGLVMRARLFSALIVVAALTRLAAAEEPRAQFRLEGGQPHVGVPFQLELVVEGFDEAPAPDAAQARRSPARRSRRSG